MAATVCGFCRSYSHMTVKWANGVTWDSMSYFQGVATCDNCGMASVANRERDDWEQPHTAEGSLANSDTLDWHPRTVASPGFADVPDHIARAAKEAHEAKSINALMAAILMARTVVEATAKERGIATGNLIKKIDQMNKEELIRKSTAEAAHEIRHFGNDMAHGDIDDLPSDEDTSEVLTLMDEILNEVYQGPARTARVKNKRTQPESYEDDAPQGRILSS